MTTAETADPHPLHVYIARLIADRLKERHVVVIYDKNEELRPFFAELTTEPATDALVAVRVGYRTPHLCVYDGSFLKVRFLVEPVTGGEVPEDTLIYVPGRERDEQGSLLMELEKGGDLYRVPALKQLARNVLRKRFTDVAIDEMLKSDALRYSDFARMSQDDGAAEGPSLLKGIFGVTDSLSILTEWLANSVHDAEIVAKGAEAELRGLADARLGTSLPQDADMARLRANVARHVLANEFRSDLSPKAKLTAAAQQALSGIAAPSMAEQSRSITEICRRLRERYATAYVSLADQVEQDLNLKADQDLGSLLGCVDTLRFEEQSVALACFNLIAAGNFKEAKGLVDARSESFWIDRDVTRLTVWQACRLMLDLGIAAEQADGRMKKANGNAAAWVERYVDSQDGWHQLDRVQRRLEAILPELEDEIPERAIGRVRAIYDDAVRRMSEGFLSAFEKGGCTIPSVLHQTRVWSELVQPLPKPVVLMVVDALRYEMGAELAGRIANLGEIQLRPAIAALPSITPIGMGALLPGASSDFAIGTQNGRFGAVVGGAFCPDLSARLKYLKAQVPEFLDLTLDDTLSGNTKSLKKRLGTAKVILIRSTEIDAAGENTGTVSARRIMERVIEDIARCLQRIAAAGIENVVITADHGHLFFASDRVASMRIDAPGGDTADLHRRCWTGRGGATPPGSVRIPGSRLGYNTDLDVVLPASISVFKSGGDLAYHHGGASLQEMVIPVIKALLKTKPEGRSEKNAVTVGHDFDAVTNRIFSVRIELGGAAKNLFEQPRRVRPIVVSGERQVAAAGVAVGAPLEDGCLLLEPGVPATAGFILTDDTVEAVRIQVLDADTDALLFLSPQDLPVRLGV
ncbi:PglZ domain-containing protein [Filomicrobium insigne]|uniref:PglZ domain-containing protein n=1 Tax=Filomicrobium insigne TaxID=418854 RepID=A0A1H0N3I6_9HYPH|nr:PglZ domain-containing protein [Filomicrobium insigne]SDO87075.1 PglZ domain-containing protein [Filomicrobium insigne]